LRGHLRRSTKLRNLASTTVPAADARSALLPTWVASLTNPKGGAPRRVHPPCQTSIGTDLLNNSASFAKRALGFILGGGWPPVRLIPVCPTWVSAQSDTTVSSWRGSRFCLVNAGVVHELVQAKIQMVHGLVHTR
jgi:hypothetical protein